MCQNYIKKAAGTLTALIALRTSIALNALRGGAVKCCTTCKKNILCPAECNRCAIIHFAECNRCGVVYFKRESLVQDGNICGECHTYLLKNRECADRGKSEPLCESCMFQDGYYGNICSECHAYLLENE